LESVLKIVRPLAFLLAAAAFCGSASAQTLSINERIEQCASCHGEGGNSLIENIPSLAGQPAFFILNQLFLMREGVRKIEAMMPFVKDLKDEDLQALSQHFSKLPPKRSNEKIDPALVARGKALSERMRCNACHLPDLSGQEQMPRVAKQRIDYLIHSLKEFRDNRRSGADTQMSAAIFGASDADIAALAHYAASL
jgi:cytochrome c553